MMILWYLSGGTSAALMALLLVAVTGRAQPPRSSMANPAKMFTLIGSVQIMSTEEIIQFFGSQQGCTVVTRVVLSIGDTSRRLAIPWKRKPAEAGLILFHGFGEGSEKISGLLGLGRSREDGLGVV